MARRVACGAGARNANADDWSTTDRLVRHIAGRSRWRLQLSRVTNYALPSREQCVHYRHLIACFFFVFRNRTVTSNFGSTKRSGEVASQFSSLPRTLPSTSQFDSLPRSMY
jgi:hypothetical protein